MRHTVARAERHHLVAARRIRRLRDGPQFAAAGQKARRGPARARRAAALVNRLVNGLVNGADRVGRDGRAHDPLRVAGRRQQGVAGLPVPDLRPDAAVGGIRARRCNTPPACFQLGCRFGQVACAKDDGENPMETHGRECLRRTRRPRCTRTFCSPRCPSCAPASGRPGRLRTGTRSAQPRDHDRGDGAHRVRRPATTDRSCEPR